MSKSNAVETDILSYILKAAAPSWDAVTDLYIALHTADPGEAGDQTTSEATYTSYARIAVARSGAGWTVTGNQGVNAGTVTFDECTGGSNTITHASVGVASSGASKILYSGALSASLAVSNGVTPRFPAGTLVMTED